MIIGIPFKHCEKARSFREKKQQSEPIHETEQPRT
jgi:hypothetical protein